MSVSPKGTAVTLTKDQEQIWGAVQPVFSGIYGPPSIVERKATYVRLAWERGRSLFLRPGSSATLHVVVHDLDEAAIQALAKANWAPRGPDARSRVTIEVTHERLAEVPKLGAIYKRGWKTPTVHAK